MTAALQQTAGEDLVGEILPFSKTKQEALMGYLLTDLKFQSQARHRIKPEWWSDPRLSQVWSLVLLISQRVDRPITADELTESQDMARLDPKESNRLQGVIRISLEKRIDIGLDMLQTELTDWLRTRIYVTVMKRGEALFNSGLRTGDTKKLEEAYSVIREMTKEIADTTFDAAQIEEMDDPIGDFERQVVDADDAISWGLPALDRLLLPEGQGRGSLLAGDMTVLLAPTNIGKTTTMVTIAALNVWAGRDVLLITHEGRVNDIKLKIWQSMMGMSRQDVMSNLTNKEFQAAMAQIKALVQKHLEFLPLNKAGMTVEEVAAVISRRQDRWRANHNGKGFNLLIDDYAAKLTTAQARGGNFQLRQIHEVVYNYFTQIALEHDFHVITAIQTNREGSRANSKHGKNIEGRLLVMEDVAEAWGPMTTATNVISINRDPISQAKGIVTYYICKSRSSEVGWAIACKSNFAAARSHWPETEATWYRGTSPMSEKIDSLLSGFPGQEIPWQEVLKIENSE